MKQGRLNIRFRKQLKTELGVMQSEGLIDESQAGSISDRYQLDDLATEATGKLLMAIYLIGAFLIGVGIVSFVAYHWNAMGKGLKLSIIFTAMLASHVAGFYLWKVKDVFPKLGHSLICLGTLIFGANIGLIAQMFHIKGEWNGLFLPWAIGAIVMAYAVGSAPNAVIGLITSFIWFIGTLDWYGDAAWWYPFAAAALFGGYAYYQRCKPVFTMTLVAIAISLPISMASGDGEGFGVMAGMLSVGLLFFSLGLLSRKSDDYKDFAAPAYSIGMLSTAIVLFLNSFLDFSVDIISDAPDFFNNQPHLVASGAVVFALAIAMCWFGFFKNRDNLAFQIIAAIMLTSLLAVTAGCFTSDLVVFANVLFVALGCVLTWSARIFEDRRLFWSGILIIASFVIARTLEYETGLLIKSAVFIACGVALMVAGVMFEKFLKARRISSE